MRTRLFIATMAAAAVAIAGLIIASQVGSDETAASPEPAVAIMGAAETSALFSEIPQHGAVLGAPSAPVTLVEYADLQCPYCAQWARDTFPAIVDEYVRAGRVRLVLRGLTFLGPDSETAMRAALAAGEQDRLWDVVHGLFLRQGRENSGWVTERVLRSVAGSGIDTEQMLQAKNSVWVERQLEAARTAAEAARVPGTPFFQAGRTGGALGRLQLESLEPEAFRRELDRLLAE
jgi:protein-disulfide isomerase